MKTLLISVLVPATLLVVCSGSAAFADELAPAPAVSAQAGWYLRLDTVYTFDHAGGGTISIRDPDFAGPSTIRYDELRLGWNHDVSSGIGYQFNDYLRGDVTVGNWGRSLDGVSRYQGLNSWTYRDEASLNAWEALVNAYVDIGRIGRVTPYVGGGVGVARLKYNAMTSDADCACGIQYTATQPGLASSRFAYALMAGAAIDLSSSLKLDLGYRFSGVDGGRAFGWDESDRAAGQSGAQIVDDGFQTHQIKVGLRKHFY